MRTVDVAHLLGAGHTHVLRTLYRVSETAPVGSGAQHHWSPGEALAAIVLSELDGHESFIEGARKCGEALDNGYPPAFLVTRGGCESVLVIESEDPRATDEMVTSLLLQASDAGAAVRVVRLRPYLELLDPYVRELVDV